MIFYFPITKALIRRKIVVRRTGKQNIILQKKVCQNMMQSVEKTAGLGVASSKLSANKVILKALFMPSMKTWTPRGIVCFVHITSKTPTMENLCGQLKSCSKLLNICNGCFNFSFSETSLMHRMQMARSRK